MDFFTEYLQYTSGTESPTIFHRWSAIASVGAFLERQYSFQLGHFNIIPNTYCMLIGTAGSRKSAAIKIAKNILKTANYTTIAADRTTKEKFLMDLAGLESPDQGQDILEQNLFGNGTANDVSNCFIMADEFNDFFGNNNIEFISLLGSLWDYSGVYETKYKNSKSLCIPNPTISILGGNTPTGFRLAFPVEILGQGFFSRLILVYADPSGRKITFPKQPPQERLLALVEKLQHIKLNAYGNAKLTSGAESLLDKIYRLPNTLQDVRFDSYFSRRFTHLLKLCLIHSAGRFDNTITELDVVRSNTVLYMAEKLMPKALGEFGKAKNSDTVHKIVQIVETSTKPVTLKDLWALVHSDLENFHMLAEVIRGLVQADKIQSALIDDTCVFLPKKRLIVEMADDTLDWDYLTEEEKGMSV